jgi:hypothetical protein
MMFVIVVCVVMRIFVEKIVAVVLSVVLVRGVWPL